MSEGNTQRITGTARIAFRAVFTLCLIGTVCFIFYNSSQIGEISGGKSALVTEAVNGLMERLRIGFRFSEHLIRKLAHFSEYALLGFWLMMTLRIYTRRILSFVSWPLFLGLLVAVVDEFYQLFVPERSGQVQDVVIDFCGVVVGLCLALFVLLLFSAIWDAFHGKR